MTATSVGMRCPECSNQRTKVKRMGAVTEPVLTYALIGINVAVALGGFLSGASATGGGSLGASSLVTDGSLYAAAVKDGDYWRLVTSGFLHAGFLHLLFNMYVLWFLGTMLEPAIGRLRFAVIYFVSLLAGSFGALLLDPDKMTVGASGAIFGLAGAAMVVMRNRGVDSTQIAIFLGINLLITFALPGISIGGHLGGLFGGAAAAALMFELPDRVRLPAIAPTLLAAALGAAAVIASIAVSSSPV
jgi:membrane associated rhomboid family serine protease